MKRSTARFFAFGIITLGLMISYFLRENASAEAQGDVLRLQLRTRSEQSDVSQELPYLRGREIQYRTVTWHAAETVLVCDFADRNADEIATASTDTSTTSSRERSRLERAREIVDHAKSLGVRVCFNFDKTGDLREFSANDSAKNAVFLVARLTPETGATIDALARSGKNVVVFRDLLHYDTDENGDFSQTAAQKRDDEIKHIERSHCPTIDSCDWLDKPAFRFPEDKRPHVAFLVSDDHYHADKTLPVFAGELAAGQGFYTSVLHGEGTNTFAHMAELQTVDVLIVYVRRLAPPKGQLDLIREFVESGRGGLIGMRTASHAFDTKGRIPDGHDNWVEFDRDILGGNYHDHGRNDLGSDIAPAQTPTGGANDTDIAAEHAVLDGLEPQCWHSVGSLYWTAPIKDDAILLQTGSSEEGQNEPLTWLRHHGQTRVAYTGLGHQHDFETEAFRSLLANLVRWASEK